MSKIPLVASAEDLPSAIRFAQHNTESRWFVASRANALKHIEDIPDEWTEKTAITASITAAVKQFSQAERDEFAKSKVAMADGSYPIPDKAHITAALDDYNRTGQPADVKKHIIQRAVALDATSELPADWVDPDHDGDNDLIASKDTDHDDASYRKSLGLKADAMPSTPAPGEEDDEEPDEDEDPGALTSAIDYEALVSAGYYTDYGVEDDYDNYEVDSELPLTASGSVLVAAAFTADQRKAYAKDKIALADGSFPIPNKRFLGKAIRAVGRAKNNSKDTIKKHIAKRAKALGATYMLPDSYKGVTAASNPAIAMAKSLLREKIAPITAAAAEEHESEKAALRERAGLPKADGSEAPGTPVPGQGAVTIVAANAVKDIERGFDDALHPRGKDGKFITKGGRVIADDGAGHRVEGTVEAIHAGLGGQAHIQIKTDQGHTVLTTADHVTNAPTAVAHLGENPQTAADHLRLALHHNAEASKALDAGDREGASAHADMAREHNAASLKAATADELTKLHGAAKPGAQRQAVNAEISRRVNDRAGLTTSHTGGKISGVGNFDHSKVANASRVGESREASEHLRKFQPGDHVVHTDEQGKEHVGKVTRQARGDLAYDSNGKVVEAGSEESRSVDVNYRPGGYTAPVNNHNLTTGKQNIRHATSAEAEQYEAGARKAADEGVAAKSAAEKAHPVGSKVQAPRSYNAPAGEGEVTGHTPNGLVKVSRKGYSNEDVENAHKPEELTSIGSKADTDAKLAEDVGGKVTPQLRSDTEKAAEGASSHPLAKFAGSDGTVLDDRGIRGNDSVSTDRIENRLNSAGINTQRFGHQLSINKTQNAAAKQALRDRVGAHRAAETNPVGGGLRLKVDGGTISEGDHVTVNGRSGVVESIGRENVTIRREDGMTSTVSRISAPRVISTADASKVATPSKPERPNLSDPTEGEDGLTNLGRHLQTRAAEIQAKADSSSGSSHQEAVVEQLKRMGYSDRTAKGARNLTSKDKSTRITVNDDGSFGMKVNRGDGVYSARKHGVDTSGDAHSVASALHEAGKAAPAVKPHKANSAEDKITQARKEVLRSNVAKNSDGTVPVYNIETGKVQHVSPEEATAGHIRYGQSLGAGTPAAGQTVKNALDARQQQLTERAVQMFGSDRSNWSMADLRSAAKNGDTQAAAALKVKLRAKAGKA